MRILFNKLVPRRVLHLCLQPRQNEHHQSVRLVVFKAILGLGVLIVGIFKFNEIRVFRLLGRASSFCGMVKLGVVSVPLVEIFSDLSYITSYNCTCGRAKHINILIVIMKVSP